jgi:translation initiation factor eIF-2B subunit delta
MVIKQSTKVMMGAATVYCNGDVMSRSGSSIVCMSAHDNNIPVIILCESYKFSESVRLDSLCTNEFG